MKKRVVSLVLVVVLCCQWLQQRWPQQLPQDKRLGKALCLLLGETYHLLGIPHRPRRKI